MNTKHLHVLQKQLLLFLFLTLAITSCRDEKDKAEEPMKSEAYYSGEVRFAHTGEKTVPGLYDCYFTNREDFSELVVAAIVYSEEGDIVFVPKTPIRTGEYYFNRAVTVETENPADKELIGQDLPLGCKISFTSTEFSVKEEKMDPLLECYGSGTKEDPYLITSYVHLENLMDLVNSTDVNYKKYGDKYYKQTADLSLSIPCSNLNNGWKSIGNHITRPFAGHYNGSNKKIKNMTIKRKGNIVPQPAGLFGIVINATIDSIQLESCKIISDYAVAGMLVGSVITTGKDRLTTSITGCNVNSTCNLTAPYLAGGLVGGVDQFARLIMINCSNKMNISCDVQGVGGLIGASFLTSSVTLDNCKNSGTISCARGVVGGLIGSTDTLLVSNCVNTGAITGGNGSIGTGGLIGVGLNVVSSFCDNSGIVTGDREVGGILGSAARNSSAKIYGDAHVYTSSNTGKIEGVSEVGGLVGSAQIMISGSYNFAQVKATGKNVGGLAGLGPMAVIIGSSNDGNVLCTGSKDDCFVGGVLGSAQDYILTGCNNFGEVQTQGTGTAGGILGGCDMLGTVSYCGNYGNVSTAKGSVGGIIGRAGKPKNMSDKMIADMVLGTAMSIATIGMTGGQMHNAGGNQKKAAQFKAMDKKIDVAGKILNSFTLINDLHWTSVNNVLASSTLTTEKLKHLEVTIRNELREEHNNKINTMRWAHNGLDLTDLAKKQQELQDSLVSRLQNDCVAYQNHVDQWRNDVEGKMHAKEQKRETANHVGELLSFTGDILGYCPIPNPVSILVTAVVAIYNLVMNLTDYSYNRVGIIQCYNYGTVTAPSGNYGGGIAGELHDYARLYNSVNLGQVNGTKVGLLIGLGGHLPEVTHSVNINPQSHDLYYSCPFSGGIKNNVTVGKGDVFSQNTYINQGFDFTKAWAWLSPFNIPLVYQSQFE